MRTPPAGQDYTPDRSRSNRKWSRQGESGKKQQRLRRGPGQVDPGHPRVNEVNTRETNQQDRIANGVKNGQLTPGQTSRLENREQHIENQQKADMAAHNGHLTNGEQKQLNKEQNHVSKQIYKDKHSGKWVGASAFQVPEQSRECCGFFSFLPPLPKSVLATGLA
jgi:hypothetical protein